MNAPVIKQIEEELSLLLKVGGIPDDQKWLAYKLKDLCHALTSDEHTQFVVFRELWSKSEIEAQMEAIEKFNVSSERSL